jgi:hypothetical protein
VDDIEGSKARKTREFKERNPLKVDDIHGAKAKKPFMRRSQHD